MVAAASKGYPLRLIPFMVPWAVLDLPDEVFQRLLADAGPVYALIHRVVRRRFARREAVAFRYA